MARFPGALNATFVPRLQLGAYELLVELARGGVATAIVARKAGAAGFERLFVIKRVHRKLLGNVEFAKMFRDEARLASSIRHANVGSVIDVIETGTELCLVMEYFEALSISALLHAALPDRAPSPRIVSRMMSDALAGLDAAHAATDLRHNKLGIVHRDFTPQNIITDTDGVSRVIDFGIAKATSRLTRTKSGIVKGKVAYMAPEQIEGHPLDGRADIFAAGIVLHEMLTGRTLFSGDDDFDTMRRILSGKVTVGTRVSPAVDAVVQQALERQRNARFPTAVAFQAALEKALPPATAREVGVWVQRVGGSTLASRRKEILRMLRESVETSAPSAAPPEDDAPALEFLDPTGVTGDSDVDGVAGLPSRGTSKLVLRVGVAVLAVGVLAGGAALYRSRTAHVPADDPPVEPRVR